MVQVWVYSDVGTGVAGVANLYGRQKYCSGEIEAISALTPLGTRGLLHLGDIPNHTQFYSLLNNL